MHKHWAVIAAAGAGARMGATLPKQYLTLCDKPVLQHSMERLLSHPAITGLVVAVAQHDQYFKTLSEQARHYGKPINTAPGGAERCHSVLNALRKLAQFAAADDWVLVHDAARPCVRHTDLSKLISTLSNHPVGGLLAVRVTDTVKCADASGHVAETQARAGLWLAQTPQMFRLGKLTEALNRVVLRGPQVTDDAEAMEALGERPLLVEGHADNIKITHPGDLALAEFYLKQQEQLA